MKTLDELLDEGRRLYYEGSLTIKEAVDKLVHEEVDDDAEYQIRRVGINELLHRSIEVDRGTRKATRRPGGGKVHYRPTGQEGQASRLYKLYPRLAITRYNGADGQNKPLLEFTFDDWKHRAQVERGRIRGAEQRLRIVAAAAEALQVEGKTKTSQLSKRTLENLEALVVEVHGPVEAVVESESTDGGPVGSGRAR